MKRIFICLSAFIVMTAFTVFGADQIDKQGFDVAMNVDFSQGNILYHIPNYYSDFAEEKEGKVIYAEESNNVAAQITFNCTHEADYSKESTIQELKDTIVETISDDERYDIQFSCDTLVAGIPGFIVYSLNRNDNISDWFVLIFNEEHKNLQTIELLEATDAKFSYTSDFLKILMSAEEYEGEETEIAENRAIDFSQMEPAENEDEQNSSNEVAVQESGASEPATEAANEFTYILNTNTKKFHYPDCKSVSQMKDKNKKEFTGTRDEAIDMGYKPCGNCQP